MAQILFLLSFSALTRLIHTSASSLSSPYSSSSFSSFSGAATAANSSASIAPLLPTTLLSAPSSRSFLPRRQVAQPLAPVPHQSTPIVTPSPTGSARGRGKSGRGRGGGGGRLVGRLRFSNVFRCPIKCRCTEELPEMKRLERGSEGKFDSQYSSQLTA